MRFNNVAELGVMAEDTRDLLLLQIYLDLCSFAALAGSDYEEVIGLIQGDDFLGSYIIVAETELDLLPLEFDGDWLFDDSKVVNPGHLYRTSVVLSDAGGVVIYVPEHLAKRVLRGNSLKDEVCKDYKSFGVAD